MKKEKIIKIIENEIKNFWNVALTNPCYNSATANDDFLKKLHELDKKYNCHVDPFDYTINFNN